VIFPHNIGSVARATATLVESVARITADEVVGTGLDWTFSPCIAVPRDERWAARTRLRGDAGARRADGRGRGTRLSAGDPRLRKHYVGDGGTTGGVDQGNTQLSEAQLRAIHLPGYRAA